MPCSDPLSLWHPDPWLEFNLSLEQQTHTSTWLPDISRCTSRKHNDFKILKIEPKFLHILQNQVFLLYSVLLVMAPTSTWSPGSELHSYMIPSSALDPKAKWTTKSSDFSSKIALYYDCSYLSSGPHPLADSSINLLTGVTGPRHSHPSPTTED